MAYTEHTFSIHLNRKMISIKMFRNPIGTAYLSTFEKSDSGFPYALLIKDGVIEVEDKSMDVLIRNIEPLYIKEIDRKAEFISTRIGRNFSRNEYIQMLIQNDCELRLMELKKDKFDQAVENLTVSLGNHDKKLQEFIDSNNRLFHFMASGIDVSEGVEDL